MGSQPNQERRLRGAGETGPVALSARILRGMEDDPFEVTNQILTKIKALEAQLPAKLKKRIRSRRRWWSAFAYDTLVRVTSTLIAALVIAVLGAAIGAIRGIPELTVWIGGVVAAFALGGLVLALAAFPEERELRKMEGAALDIALIEAAAKRSRGRQNRS